MRLELEINDRVLAEALVSTLDRYDVRRRIDEALGRIGPQLDAMIVAHADPIVRAEAARIVADIIEARVRRMAQKDGPLFAPIVEAAAAKVEQMRLEVTR